MKRRFGLVALSLTLLFGVLFASTAPTYAAPRTHAHAALFDKTRFLLHMGLAFGAFHHWVYKPYKAHAFSKGASGRTKTIIKAALASLFAAHEVKKAYDIAKGSSSPTLQKLVAPIAKFNTALSNLGNKLKKNPASYTDALVNNANGPANLISSEASKGGYGIKDIVTSSLGL
jgi:hypothetical protein